MCCVVFTASRQLNTRSIGVSVCTCDTLRAASAFMASRYLNKIFFFVTGVGAMNFC